MILKIVSIIFLSSLLTGCFTTNENIWTVPPKPKSLPISFSKITDGYFITESNAKVLADNIDEMKAYEQKMELLVNKMAKFYNIKLEEYSAKK